MEASRSAWGNRTYVLSMDHALFWFYFSFLLCWSPWKWCRWTFWISSFLSVKENSIVSLEFPLLLYNEPLETEHSGKLRNSVLQTLGLRPALVEQADEWFMIYLHQLSRGSGFVYHWLCLFLVESELQEDKALVPC